LLDYDYDRAADHLSQRSPNFAEFAHYEEFLSRELPPRVRRELEIAVEKELEPVEERIKSQVVDIVRNLQLKLFRSYQQSSKFPLTSIPESQEGTTLASGSSDVAGEGPGGGIAPSGLNTAMEDLLAPFLAPPDLEEEFGFDASMFLLQSNEGLSDSGYISMPAASSAETSGPCESSSNTFVASNSYYAVPRDDLAGSKT
jgi:hypothetical protein